MQLGVLLRQMGLTGSLHNGLPGLDTLCDRIDLGIGRTFLVGMHVAAADLADLRPFLLQNAAQDAELGRIGCLIVHLGGLPRLDDACEEIVIHSACIGRLSDGLDKLLNRGVSSLRLLIQHLSLLTQPFKLLTLNI